MKKIITFGLILLMSTLTYGYTVGQIVSQNSVNNYDTDKTFNELWIDLDCTILKNGVRQIVNNKIVFMYQVECYDLMMYDSDSYIIYRNSISKYIPLELIKNGIRWNCGDNPSQECKSETIGFYKNNLRNYYINNIMSFLNKIYSWQEKGDIQDTITISFD